ncbi:MAG: G1 family glutamic endopeptidase [Thermoplasmatales archaeon]
MNRTGLVLILGILVIFSFLIVPVATDSANQVPSALFHSAPNIREGSTSLNWAGYVVTASQGAISRVDGSFTIPTVDTGGNSYASFWVGIDGFNDGTVEQTGILAEPSGHGPHSSTEYLVWYEFYPSAPVYASFTAAAGDIVHAFVNYSSFTNEFTTYIAVFTPSMTQVGTFGHTQLVSGALDDSAEWIVEAPSSVSGILPLANFGTAYFGSDYTPISLTNYVTISGVSGPISSFSYQSITMVTTNGTPEATPSSLTADGTSFTVVYNQVTGHNLGR